jgi:hypothetical protein
MKRRLLFVAFAAVVSTTFSTASQAHPDFSGRWTLEPDPAPAPAPPGGPPPAPARGDMGSGWGSPLTITQDAAQLTVEYTVYTRYDLQPPLKFVYALDGSESKSTVVMGRGAEVRASRHCLGRRGAEHHHHLHAAGSRHGQTVHHRSRAAAHARLADVPRRRSHSQRRPGRPPDDGESCVQEKLIKGAAETQRLRESRIFQKRVSMLRGFSVITVSALPAARTDPARWPERWGNAPSSP